MTFVRRVDWIVTGTLAAAVALTVAFWACVVYVTSAIWRLL